MFVCTSRPSIVVRHVLGFRPVVVVLVFALEERDDYNRSSAIVTNKIDSAKRFSMVME